MKNRLIRALFLCLLGVMIGAGIGWQQIRKDVAQVRAISPAAGTHAATVTPVGGDFALTDHHGAAVTAADFPGLKLVFFGFTHCPDICPAGLQKMSLVLKTLGDDGARIQPLFITVDPERDTPAVMKDYVSLYDDRLTGLTGSVEDIKAVTESFRVYAAKEEPQPDKHAHHDHSHHGDHSGHVMPSYDVNHSGYTYLLNDAGEMLTVFGMDESVADMVKEIRGFLKQS